MKIKNMTDLRNKVLKALEDVENGDIEVSKAFCIGKLAEITVSGLRSEMQYSILTGTQPNIPFYNESSNVELDMNQVKNLKLHKI